MLTAQTAGGKHIVLTNSMSLHSLREWRKHETFYCPQCKERVLLKAGDIVIPHFAHLQQTNCRDSFSEGESPAHLLGKKQLYDLFIRQSAEVTMEPFLPDIRQRPDLLVTWQDTKVPVEFQCSVIPIPLVEQRNEGYHKLLMNPIWILLTPLAIQSTSETVITVRLSHLQQYFIRQVKTRADSRVPVLLTYNPLREQFHYFSHMIHLRGTSYTMLHSIMPISRQSVPFAVPGAPRQEDAEELAKQYISARRRYLRSVIGYNQKGIHNRFLRACYGMRIQPIQLPSWIGVPTAGQEAFREPDCEWQLLLVAAMRETCKPPWKLNISFYHLFLKSFEGETDDQLSACRNYTEFLREQRIDIYRIDHFSSSDFVRQILTGRFLAMHGKY